MISRLKLTACAAALALLPAIPATAQQSKPAPGTELVDLYTWLHANPELSFKESTSSAILASELESLGFTVTTGLGDEWVREKSMRDEGTVREGVGGYGVVGVYENGEGPTVLIRADMDALPVPEQTGLDYASEVTGMTWTGVESPVMHACGHDIHMTSWVGTARELIANKDKWSGTLVMLAQPAEVRRQYRRGVLYPGLISHCRPSTSLWPRRGPGAPARGPSLPACSWRQWRIRQL